MKDMAVSCTVTAALHTLGYSSRIWGWANFACSLLLLAIRRREICIRSEPRRGGRPHSASTTTGNPAGGPVGSRHRQQLNSEFIAALLRDFRHGGPKAIERVRRAQPASYMKILAPACAARAQT